MSAHDDPKDDLLDSLLATGGRPTGSDQLRGAVFAKTVGVIRFRRRLKRLALAASLAGCYLAGAATMGLWHRAGDVRSQQAAVSPAPVSTQAPSPQPALVPSASQQFAADTAACADVLRRSADRHLSENGDVKLALRNCEHLLNLASADQRAISPQQDNWLLMALKVARSKEIRHERIEHD